MRHEDLADYLLDWGEPSTCHAGLGKLWYTSPPRPQRGYRRFDPPSDDTENSFGVSSHLKLRYGEVRMRNFEELAVFLKP